MSVDLVHYIFVTVRLSDFSIRYIMYTGLDTIGEDFRWVPAMLESRVSYPATNVFARLTSEGWELLPNTTCAGANEMVYLWKRTTPAVSEAVADE